MSYRTWLFVLLAVFYATIFVDPSLGFSVTSSSLDAQMSPWHMGTWLLAIFAYLLPLWISDPYTFRDRRAGLVRRFFGFAVDFHVCFMLTAIPLVALTLLSASVQTGEFRWHMEQTLANTWAASFGFMFSVACLISLLAAPLAMNRRSVGQVAFGYGLKAANQLQFFRACGRLVIGFLTMCSGWISVPMAATREDRRMWHDQMYDVYPLEVGDTL